MPAKRELLGQGDRGKQENEKLRRTYGCDNHQTSARASIINLLMENYRIF